MVQHLLEKLCEPPPVYSGNHLRFIAGEEGIILEVLGGQRETKQLVLACLLIVTFSSDYTVPQFKCYRILSTEWI